MSSAQKEVVHLEWRYAMQREFYEIERGRNPLYKRVSEIAQKDIVEPMSMYAACSWSGCFLEPQEAVYAACRNWGDLFTDNSLCPVGYDEAQMAKREEAYKSLKTY